MKILHRLLLTYAALLVIAFIAGALLALAWDRFERAPWYQIGLLGIAGSAVAAFGLRFAIAQAQAMSQPLQRIAQAAKTIAEGEFDVKVEASRLVEANIMAANFNAMAAALKTYKSTSIDRLLAEQRRNDVVLGSIDDGLIIVDESARIERLNPIAARQLGTTVELAIGLTLDELLGGERFNQRIVDDIASQSLSQDDEPDLVIGEGVMQRRLAIALTPFTDETRPGLVLLLRDVTEEREQEKLKMDFVLRASHELRTPVSGLRMAMDLLAERAVFAPDTREADLFETVHTETKRLGDLVTDLLDVSRLSHADTPLKLEAVQLPKLAEEAHARFEPMAMERPAQDHQRGRRRTAGVAARPEPVFAGARQPGGQRHPPHAAGRRSRDYRGGGVRRDPHRSSRQRRRPDPPAAGADLRTLCPIRPQHRRCRPGSDPVTRDRRAPRRQDRSGVAARSGRALHGELAVAE